MSIIISASKARKSAVSLTWENHKEDITVTGVSYNSKETKPGDLFVCLSGFFTDGHKYIDHAIENGAVAVLAQDVDVAKEKAKEHDGIWFGTHENTRAALAVLSREFFDFPDEQIKVIGITGTKGKTTTTYMIKSILEEAHHHVGLIGTIEMIIGNEHEKSANTTPESYEIFHALRRMVDAGDDVCVMEVSSQAMKLDRCFGLHFDYVAVTNISKDHIGPNEHATFEEYVDCKKMVLAQAKEAALNIDDALVKSEFTHEKALYFSASQECDIYADASSIVLHMDHAGFDTSFTVHTPSFEGKVSTHLPGVFNVKNAMCAIAITSYFDVDLASVQRGLSHVHVPGRAQNVSKGKYQLIIDYAHSGESLKALLKAVKEYPHKRTITVFGCGGNRAEKRREEMGQASGKYADITIITTDNPRYEDPMAIIEQIKEGVLSVNPKATYYIEEKRKDAINKAIEIAEEGDIILVVGKGHESTVEVMGKLTEESDEGLVNEIYTQKGII